MVKNTTMAEMIARDSCDQKDIHAMRLHAHITPSGTPTVQLRQGKSHRRCKQCLASLSIVLHRSRHMM